MKTNDDSEETRSAITFRSADDVEYRATPLRVTRYNIAFEHYMAGGGLRVSEMLQDFKIVLGGRLVYTGRATVKNLLKTGMAEVGEVSLDEGWADVEMSARPGGFQAEYDRFISEWDGQYRIAPDFKALVADMQVYLTNLRLWVDQTELGFRGETATESRNREAQMLQEVSTRVIAAMNAMFEKYEVLMAAVPYESRPVHRAYLQRQLHPLVLCSPFAHRTFTKPLGYAGDYEMVNMLLRDPFDGETLFARLLNSWFIAQPPAEAHRNRIQYLTQKLAEETVRVAALRRQARIFNLGCGPAGEVQLFLEQDLADRAEMVMLDFNDQALAYTTGILTEIKRRHGRTMPLQLVKKSVMQIIKAAGKTSSTGSGELYDCLYCAGLFDYLPDHVCRQLMNIFYEMISPGGLLLITNVDACNPIRHMLDNLLEWHLIYRDAGQLRTLAPKGAALDDVRVSADYTGVNLFMEIRKSGS